MFIVLTSLALSAWFLYHAIPWLRQYLHEEMLYKLLERHCLDRQFWARITNINPWETPLLDLSRTYHYWGGITASGGISGMTACAPGGPCPMWHCDCKIQPWGVGQCDVCKVIRPLY